jgi:hypothetical protein
MDSYKGPRTRPPTSRSQRREASPAGLGTGKARRAGRALAQGWRGRRRQGGRVWRRRPAERSVRQLLEEHNGQRRCHDDNTRRRRKRDQPSHAKPPGKHGVSTGPGESDATGVGSRENEGVGEDDPTDIREGVALDVSTGVQIQTGRASTSRPTMEMRTTYRVSARLTPAGRRLNTIMPSFEPPSPTPDGRRWGNESDDA